MTWPEFEEIVDQDEIVQVDCRSRWERDNVITMAEAAGWEINFDYRDEIYSKILVPVFKGKYKSVGGNCEVRSPFPGIVLSYAELIENDALPALTDVDMSGLYGELLMEGVVIQ